MNIFIAILIFFPMVGALIAYLVGCKNKKARDIVVNAVTVTEFLLVLFTVLNGLAMIHQISVESGYAYGVTPAEYGAIIRYQLELPKVCGMGLSFVLDGFRCIYALVVAFMWMMVTLLSPQYFEKYRNRNRFYAFHLLTLGATVGVFLSADFFTTFVFFEMMSLTSYVWVAHDEKKETMKAAETYLGISVIGGMVMLMGLFMLYSELGTLRFDELKTMLVNTTETVITGQGIAAAICILFGFAVKAGAFPVHIWLPKAHPVAPAPASALLSGVLTKTGIYGIMLVSFCLLAREEWFGYVLLAIAVITMLLGAILALASVDLKRVLACSSLSQIGFILVGVAVYVISGMHNELAARGTLIYMVNHSVLKLVLFMAAGVIYMNTHTLDLNALKGFGRKKPILHACFALGVLGISGIPFFNGYIGKTLIHEGLVETASIPGWVEWLFLIAGGCTLAYMLKLYIWIFIFKNNDAKLQEKYDGLKKYLKIPGAVALIGSAAVIPVLGMVPNLITDAVMDFGQGFFGLYSMEMHSVHYFAFHNLKGTLGSVLIGLTLYFIIIGMFMQEKKEEGTVYINIWPEWLDLENLIYRPVLIQFFLFVCQIVCRTLDCIIDTLVIVLRKTLYRDSKLPHELPEGNIITHAAAVVTQDIVWVLNHTFLRHKPIRKKFDHWYALHWEEYAEDSQIIGRSLSYGLMLFCVGLVATIVYLLLVVFRVFI